jgi:RNA polymerase subunit RPABC4/transcription elongation factor Spt4
MVQKKMVVCKNCNTPILKKAKACPNCGAKNKKPFYKKGWFVFLIIVIAFAILISISNDDTKKIEWNSFELSYLLPEPKSNKGRLLTDTEDNLSIYISKSSKEDFDGFIDECKDRGFVIEAEKSDSNYTAYNENGFKLALWYDETDKEYHIDLSAQAEMTELEWPTRGLGSMLPDPYETIGKIVRDDSDYFSVIVGEMDEEDFKYYIEDCEDEGFTVDYSKTEEYFSAKNKDGYNLTVNYAGFNTVEITLTKPADNDDIQANDNKPQNDEDVKTEVKGIRTEFKQAMDAYEEFMDEYVIFMKKYADSNGNDLTLLADYADYMSKYATFVEDFEKWDNEEMSDEEFAYYMQVQSRVYQKLSEIE